MPEPSGTAPSGTSFHYISNVTNEQFAEASAALDRALLKAVGLPEHMDIRELENALYAMTGKIKSITTDFSLSKLFGILPELIMDGAALWEKVEPKLGDDISRKEFIARVIQYAYRKNDPDIPVLQEPFESIVEDMLLNAVPEMLDNLEKVLGELFTKLKDIFS